MQRSRPRGGAVDPWLALVIALFGGMLIGVAGTLIYQRAAHPRSAMEALNAEKARQDSLDKAWRPSLERARLDWEKMRSNSTYDEYLSARSELLYLQRRDGWDFKKIRTSIQEIARLDAKRISDEAAHRISTARISDSAFADTLERPLRPLFAKAEAAPAASAPKPKPKLKLKTAAAHGKARSEIRLRLGGKKSAPLCVRSGITAAGVVCP